MIVDIHTHIFSNDVCRDRRPCLADRQFQCLFASDKTHLIGHEELLNAMERSGIDHAVAMGFPWEHEDHCAYQNEYFSSVMKSSGGTILPFGSVPVNPATDIPAWVRDIKEMGLRGVGEVGFYFQGMIPSNLDFLKGILAAVRTYALPLCLHVNEPLGHSYQGKYDPRLGDLYSVLAQYPDVTVILSHWGGGMVLYELMPEVSDVLRNCYYDTAASPFIYSNAIYRIAPQVAGSKKILFGSDHPLLPYGRYLDAIRREIADEAMVADILGNNAATLLNIV